MSAKCRPTGVDPSRKSIGNKQNRTKPGRPLPPWKIKPQYQFGRDNEGKGRGSRRGSTPKSYPRKGGFFPLAIQWKLFKRDRSDLTWPDICPRLEELVRWQLRERERGGVRGAACNLFIQPHSAAQPPPQAHCLINETTRGDGSRLIGGNLAHTGHGGISFSCQNIARCS